MYSKIDWLSFSFPANFHEKMPHSATSQYMKRCVDEECGQISDLFLFGSWAMVDKGRKPYNKTFESPIPGIKIFYSTVLKHATMEISGQGCDWFIDHEQLPRLLKAIQHRLTRLDLANDFLTPTDPIEFSDQRAAGRFKSAGQQISESGTTVYIGSRTSDRYCKVYRYNPPHERAHLLRVEYTFKSDGAKLIAQDILEHGEAACSVATGESYGWQHPAYRPTLPNLIELRSYRPEREQGKTIFWLADTVAPLLVRMHKEGQIDIHRWMDENVLRKLESPDSE